MSRLDLLKLELYGNTVAGYLLAAAVFLGALWAFLLARRLVLERLKALAARTQTDVDDFFVSLLDRIRVPEGWLVALYFGARTLALPPRFHSALGKTMLLLVTYRTVTLLAATAKFVSRKALASDGDDPGRRATANTLAAFVQAVIWVAAALFVLSNLGFNVSSMLAGLGIGGVAVALAAQAVLADLFSALAIFLDKPFEVGDNVSFDGGAGVVERIGLKTTRLRAPTGEQLVVGNAQLTSAKIRNFRRQSERRVALKFGLAHASPEAELALVPGAVKALVEKEPTLVFERAHLVALDDGFEFEASWLVKDAELKTHLDAQQRVLLGLVAELRRRKLDLIRPLPVLS